MNNINFSPAAQNDLIEIMKYIEEEFQDISAAHKTIAKIIKKISILKTHGKAGAPLAAVTHFEGHYRFLVCGNYLCFYRNDGNEVYVDRIIYHRRNYMQVLFGDRLEEDEKMQPK